MNWLLSKVGRFWPFILIGSMLILFLVSATKQENLDVYTGGNSTYTVESESETNKKVISNTYMNSLINLSMQIPDSWQHIIKDGYDTYVHSASASSIQIQVMSYYPMVNNATVDSLSESYSTRGMEITEFQFLSDNSYYLIYQSKGLSGITDYIEYVIWDRQHVAKIVVTFNDENYDKLKDELWYCLDSISWDYEDPITEGYYLTYQIEGDFEYAVPDQWTTGASDTTFYAYEEDTSSSFTVNTIQDSTMLSDITELDYSNFLSNGKSNFILNQFQQSENNIYGEATYINNETQMSVIQEYYANGTYQYILTYEFPTELGNSYAELAKTGLSMTRIFYTSDSDDSNVTETDEVDNIQSQTSMETNANSVFTPDPIPSVQNSTENQSDVIMDNQNEEVSSFSAALMSTANISNEQADTISAIWISLNLGNPTYAQAIKQNTTSRILLITTDQNVNYYISIGTDGSLQEIHADTENGTLMYPQS